MTQHRLTIWYNTRCPVCDAGIDWQRNKLLAAVRAGTIKFKLARDYFFFTPTRLMLLTTNAGRPDSRRFRASFKTGTDRQKPECCRLSSVSR
jgi:hypothetical protein